MAPIIFWMAIHRFWMTAFLLVVLALITDWLDGYLAKRLQVENFCWGEYIDSTSDIVVCSGALLGLYYTGVIDRTLLLVLLVIIIPIWWYYLYRLVLKPLSISQQIKKYFCRVKVVVNIWIAAFITAMYGKKALHVEEEWFYLLAGLAYVISIFAKANRHQKWENGQK